MYCRHCGKQIKDESLFCTYCGQAVKKVTPVVNNTAVKQTVEPTTEPAMEPTIEEADRPQKKKKGKGIVIVILALLAVAVIVAGAYFVLDYKNSSQNQRNEWSEEEEEEEDDESDREDEDEDSEEDETEAVSDETEQTEAAPASAEELDVSQIDGLITTLCSSGNPIRNMLADPAGFNSSFMLNSIGDEADIQRILEKYPDAYREDYYLCMPEEAVRDYLKNSIGLDELSTLLEISSYEGGYSSYSDGVFSMVRPDSGDYWIGNPVITEIKTVSETEVVVSGEIISGAANNEATSLFEIVLTANPDSIWGGYTLSAITKWDTYILPHVDTEYLTEADIMNWDADYLRLARNEIYARHGRQFDDEGLKSYFESCNWYVGTVPASEFDEAVLNEYELANRDLIVQYEQEIKDGN